MKRLNVENNNPRAYVMLQTTIGSDHQASQILLRHRDVILVDEVEGPFDVIFAIQASDREQLADVLMQVIADLEPLTTDFQLMPAT